MRYLPLALAVILLSCGSKRSVINEYLHPGNLPEQLLTINTATDTVVLLQHGTRLTIPAGSLQTKDGAPAKLVAKEALTIQDIMLAGLSTESNGTPLKSGGMLFLDAPPGEEVEIAKPITASIPASFADTAMQLYKGEEKDDGSINWTDPQPLTIATDTADVETGRILFRNCQSCHGIHNNSTGPALFGAEKRIGSKEVLYRWIHNPPSTMAHYPYFCDLQKKFGGVIMQPFPALTNEEIDKIFLYINKQGLRENNNREYVVTDAFPFDSCAYYLEFYQDLSQQRDSLAAIREKFIQEHNTVPDTGSIYYRPPIDKIPSEDIVSPPDYDADHYIITIKTFGWYNVDIPLGIPETDSELDVTIGGTHAGKNEVFLVIPSSRTFQRGGLLSDGTRYGFYDKSGKIGLKQGEPAYVFAIGENKDTAQLYFGSAMFTTSHKQSLAIEMRAVTKDQLERAIKGFRFDNIDIESRRTYTKETLKTVETRLSILQAAVNRCTCRGSDTTAAVTRTK